MSDVKIELAALKKKIEELEKKIGNNKQDALFGRSYSNVGSTKSDFIIKTRGQVKIQVGNHFIDLLKDGKLNFDSKFIYSINSVDDIGNKNGIYVTPDNSVYVKIGDQTINLTGEIGTTYVSFMGEQITTGDQKYTALKNIGFIYDNLNSINESSLQNGIVYIIDTKKLYTVTNGVLTEFTVEFPNPFTEQFIIQKNDSSDGALVIKGSGIENSIVFETMHIYSDESQSIINSDGGIVFKIEGDTILQMDRDNAIFNTNVVSDMIKSKDADSESGFRLYVDTNGSTLEVDNLIVRNQDLEENQTTAYIFPQFWSYKNNVIVKVEDQSTDSQDLFNLDLKYANEYKVGDKIYVYNTIKDEEKGTLTLQKVGFEITSCNAESDDDFGASSIEVKKINQDDQVEAISMIGQITFLISTGEEEINQVRYNQDSIDLLKYTNFDDEEKPTSVKTRIGKLDELELKERSNGEETGITDLGFYSDNAAFKKARYTTENELEYNDNSTNFVSTEWFHKWLPKGTILMFNGKSEEIPEGWHICDGQEGTPNLTDRFIKAGSTAGTIGGSTEGITLTVDNLPAHTHEVIIDSGTEGLAETDDESGNMIETEVSESHEHQLSYTDVYVQLQSKESGGFNMCDFIWKQLTPTPVEPGGDTETGPGQTLPPEGPGSDWETKPGEDDDDTHGKETKNLTIKGGPHKHKVNLDSLSIPEEPEEPEEPEKPTIDISSIKIGTTGEGEPIKIDPPYYTLIFIMKIV